MTQSLKDKVVIITGASSGVGEAAARQFAKAGAHVVLAARSANKIAALADDLGGLAVATDVTRSEDLARLVEQTIARFGRIDVLVNNAGANARGDYASLALGDVETIIQTNLLGPIRLTHIALPHLAATKGVVVNVASIAGHVPLPGEAAYCSSKWGLRGFTFAVREELAAQGVALCAVSPGPISTPFVLDDLENTPDLVFSQPFLTADQVAEAVLACAVDRRRERALPASTLFLARLVQALPWLQEMLRPGLEAKGAKVKAGLMAQAAA
jgi:NADP-dependent 3-hydroxy acid dehydrogenase YdfG